MGKKFKFLKNSLIIPFLTIVLPANLPAQKLDKTTRYKLDEKVEFYKVSYPPFRYQQAKNQANEKYKMFKVGDNITVNTGFRKVSGIYKGYKQGKIVVGDSVVLLKNLSKSEWYKYNKDNFEEITRKFIEAKFHAYRKKRWNDIAKYKKKLEQKYTIVDSNTATSSDKTVIIANAEVAKMPLTGIVKNDILVSSGSVKAGELLKNIKLIGFNRYQVEAQDGRIIYSDARNVYVFQELKGEVSPFSITQAAFGMLYKNKYHDAGFYSLLAARMDDHQKRSPLIDSLVKTMVGSSKALRKANAKIAKLNKEVEYTLKLLARNQNSLRDEFAVQAGTRDRSSTLTAKAVMLREKRKHIQLEIKEKILALENFCQDEVKKAASSGDFISACITYDILNRKISSLREMADVRWDEDENQKHKETLENIENYIVNAYNQKINRPFKDKWFVFLDKYTGVFGYNEAELEKFDLKPFFGNLLAASKASIKESSRFSIAVYRHDFNGIFNNGMKILVLMPRAQIAEGIRKNIENGFSEVAKTCRLVIKMGTRKLYGEVIEVAGKLNPVPLELEDNVAKAKKEVEISNAALERAVNAVEEKRYGDCFVSIKDSLSTWPGNRKAQAFYRNFMKKHKGVMNDANLVVEYIKLGRFGDAFDKCDIMFKEWPAYKNFVKKLRRKIKAQMAAFGALMVTANNYFKAGRYRDALKIYSKLKRKEKMIHVYQEMLEKARESNDVKEQVKLLELLGRWEDAGKLRKEHSHN